MTNVQASEFRSELLDTSVTSCQTTQIRPRSLYTLTDDSSYYNCQRYNTSDFKSLDSVSSVDQWCATNFGSPSTTSLWRPPSRYSLRSQPSLSYIPSEDAYTYVDPWREQDVFDSAYNGAVIATQHGTMSIRLHSRMRVDMTIDRAIRIVNLKSNIVMSLSASGSSSALLHPNGRIYQYGSRVEIQAHDINGNNKNYCQMFCNTYRWPQFQIHYKYAKMWYKGVSFTCEKCALVYLVDSAGTRTTTDSFSDMSQDISLSVFYNESRHGVGYQQEAMHLLQNAQYFVDEKKVQNWIINNVRISQTPDGLLRIARNSNKYQLRTSPSNGSATITTPFVHTTASLGQTSHLFVRRGERRMHYDGTSFIVRNAGHSAGFDEKNMLKVY